MRNRVALAALLTAAAGASHAASWAIGNATALPGQTVYIGVSFSGDGVTEGASIDLAFDEGRLSLPVASGPIPGANVSGQCARTSSKTVTGLLFSSSGALPASAQTVCLIPFTVRPTARAGRVTLGATSKDCAAGTGPQACVVSAGWVDIQGNPSATSIPAEVQTDSLIVLLTAHAPSAKQLADFDYGANGTNALLEGLREGVVRVNPPNSYPAAGDFLARLHGAPNSAESKSERYITIDFENRAMRDRARDLLAHDPFVEAVEPAAIQPVNWWQPEESGQLGAHGKALAAGSQDFFDVLSFHGAWPRAGGWALMAAIDNGVDPNHAQLRSFTGSDSVGGSPVVGGNFLPFLSRNVGGRSQPVTDVDELQPSLGQASTEEQCDASDGASDDWLNTHLVGHGTHVAGLMAGNALDQSSIRGGCTRCGLAVVKRAALYCLLPSNTVAPASQLNTDGEAIEHLYKMGVQVINMSYGHPTHDCQAASNNRVCNAIHTAWLNDILMVAAAGNERTKLNFPARDPRVVSVGGLGVDNEFWDELPSNPGCSNCASNFALSTIGTSRQEVVAPARSIRSSMYPGRNWNNEYECGDAYGDGPANDGEGLCTGTSMSSPEVAALYGILRSINPLMRVGDPVNQATPVTPDGIREIVTSTASRSIAGQPEDAKTGFGIPNAGAAVSRVLGTVRGMPVRNRLTPLFALYSPGGGDYATVATPQMAMALHLYSTNAYRSTPQGADTFLQGAIVPGYPAFPNPAPEVGVPRARAMILTTEFKPAAHGSGLPTPVPLVLLVRKRQGPTPCVDPSSPLCHGDLIVALESQLQAAINAQYSYLGLQGYIHPTCSPTPACVPLGAQALHVKCRAAIQDCAAFLEADRPAFEGAGYTANFLGAQNSMLGYAYPVTDTDGDGLTDGFEYVVGTSPADVDSDDDGSWDSVEYPLAGAPVSDPCAGPSVTCTLGQHVVFANGFE